MAEIITMTLIALMFAILGLNERHFYLHAKQYPASISNLYTTYVDNDNNTITSHKSEAAKKANVILEPSFTDGREGSIFLPKDIWENLDVGNTVTVWAYAYRPKWLFWSPMERYKHREFFIKINFILMSIFAFLALRPIFFS